MIRLVRETWREVRSHPALIAAPIMRLLGYRWKDHRWTLEDG